MTDAEKMEKIQGLLGNKILEISNPTPKRVFLSVAPEDLIAAVAALKKDLDCWYLATMTGVDVGESFEILYHFGDTHGNVNVRTRIPKTPGRLPSICAEIEGAVLYERELQDLFGIVVDGIPDPRNFLMPDGWPAGNFPLRKDWKFERPQEVIPGGGK